eukprot:TRINITY_DN122104_c0_g1_i1.p1 TRINITY_DN122104_c0_g1~~TRINITY_DN122104_c0_g1_i1.p1  ORF type:complete len:458 (-),score=103.15 TRINITY_DN122104_c0_g1_i1:72-1445(-)
MSKSRGGRGDEAQSSTRIPKCEGGGGLFGQTLGQLFCFGQDCESEFIDSAAVTIDQVESVPASDLRPSQWDCTLPHMSRGREAPCSAGTPMHLYVFAGFDGAPLKSAERYDLESGNWEPCAPLTQARVGAVAGVLRGTIFVCGGHNGTQFLNTVDVYVPTGDLWCPGPPMRGRRSYAGAAVLKGALHVLGGVNGVGVLNSAESFNPGWGEWEASRSLRQGRKSPATTTCDGRIWACGGNDGQNCLATVETFDDPKKEWQAATTMNRKRHLAVAAAVRSSLYVCGGCSSAKDWSFAQLRSVEKYNAEADKWEVVSPTFYPRCSASAAVAGNRIYIFGGFDGAKSLSHVESLGATLGSGSGSQLVIGGGDMSKATAVVPDGIPTVRTEAPQQHGYASPASGLQPREHLSRPVNDDDAGLAVLAAQDPPVRWATSQNEAVADMYKSTPRKLPGGGIMLEV